MFLARDVLWTKDVEVEWAGRIGGQDVASAE